LSDVGLEIPKIGLGTFGLASAGGPAALASAIDIGYRHLDTAQSYATEAMVGEAIARSGLDRGAFFVTTKVTPPNFPRLEESVDDSLKAMGLDYADLILIHWPAADGGPPVRDYVGAIARAQDKGRTRLIGVSNFTRRHIDEAMAEIGAGRLATNQIEQHVFLQNRALAEYCRNAGISVTAYKPVAGGHLAGNPVLDDIAAKHGVKPGQIALAFLLALGSIVIPKSATPERQRENLASAEIALDPGDIDRLEALDRNRRFVDPSWAPDWD
jgi:2,5-diketo-D-gluconate reductase B